MTQTKRTKRTQKSLREALVWLLQKKVVSDITIKELCERANINRSTFYAHYHNIIEVFEEIVSDTQDKIVHEFQNWLNKPDFHLHYAEMVKVFLQQVQKRELTYKAILKPEYFFQFTKTLTKSFMTLLSTHHSYHTTLFNVIGFFSTVRYWLFNGMKETIQEFSDQMAYVYLGTFMSEDGLHPLNKNNPLS